MLFRSGLVGVAAGIMARVKKAIQADTRHVEGCDEYRFAHEGRCLPECPVPRLVGRELAGEESGLPEDRSRFRCPFCQDTGWVSVLKPKAVMWVARNRYVPVLTNTWTGAVKCTCEAGRALTCVSEAFKEFDRDVMVVVRWPELDMMTQCDAVLNNVQNLTHKRESSFDSFNDRKDFN